MKFLSLLLVGFLTGPLFAGNLDGVETARQESEGEIKPVWPEALPEFVTESLRQARDNKKPVLVGFGADWCLPCKAMDKKVFPHPRVAGELENWVTIKIDRDQYPQLAESFSVTGLPIYYVVDENGKVIDKVAGMQLAIDFAEWLSKTRLAAR